MRYAIVATAMFGLLSMPPAADAGSVSGTLTIVIAPPAMALVINPSNVDEACEAPAGTVVSALSTTGGDGNTVSFSLTGGDVTDFAISGANVVVGPNGIAAADCGTAQGVTVSASQQ